MSDKRPPGPIYAKPKVRRIISNVENNSLTSGKKRRKAITNRAFIKKSSKKLAKKSSLLSKQNNLKSSASLKYMSDSKQVANWRRRWHFIISLTLTILTVLILLWIIFLSPVFALKKDNINIIGTGKYITKQAVLTSLKNYIGMPITVLGIDNIEKEVYLQNGVSAVEIERLWTNGLSVKITASKPIAYVQNNEQFLLLDKLGKLVQINKTSYSNFPKIILQSNNSQLTQPFMLSALADFSDSFRKDCLLISAKTFDSITTKLKSGQTIIWGSNENISQKETIVKKILANSELMVGRKTIDISATYKPIIK
ncbi:MAG: cell division protein FtsQ/DivIB [Bifidobacteriaceae bacterium]|jgi:cell division protein FtsQ|nr:cell division protein FtsQ/DivIB [Bifidobacteriaceae bacterium]